MSRDDGACVIEMRVATIARKNSKFVNFSGPIINAKHVSRRNLAFISFGDNAPIEISPGQIWRVTGVLTHKDKFNQGSFVQERSHIKALEITCILPVEAEAFVRLLQLDKRFKGIGEGKARRLWEAFGSSTYEIIRSRETDKIISATGLTDSACKRLYEGMKDYENLRYSEWLSRLGIPLNVILRILRFHKNSTIDAITDNPFRLIDFGLPFQNVSDIARINFGVPANDPRRLTAALSESMLRVARAGHTHTHTSHLKSLLIDILKDYILVDRVLKQRHPVTSVIKSKNTGFWHPCGLLVQEYTVAKRLLALSRSGSWDAAYTSVFSESLKQLTFALNENQMEAAQQALMHDVYVITGGAGTGKTTLLRLILSCYEKLGYEIHCVALAGRAAMRMHESTGIPASTIARFLRQEFDAKAEKIIVVIDEASMVDISTMYNLVVKIPPSARILLTGDANQLPPIRAGLVFSDVLRSNQVPSSVLTDVLRQADVTGIARYAEDIVNGLVPVDLSYKHIRFHDTRIEDVEATVVNLVKSARINHEVQVVGMSKRGYKQKYGGIDQVNSKCQLACNPSGKKLEFTLNGLAEFVNLRCGDPVLFTQNNYASGVFNGTLGHLVDVSQREDVLGVVLTDQGDNIELNENLLDTIELGYAMTVHKAQGSQFKHVVVMLTNPNMLNRSWLYTAITRAVDRLDIVGPKEWFIEGVAKEGDVATRRSYLRNLLQEGSFFSEAD